MAEAIPIATRVDPQMAWERYAAAVRGLRERPSRLADREYMERLARLYLLFRDAFDASENPS